MPASAPPKHLIRPTTPTLNSLPTHHPPYPSTDHPPPQTPDNLQNTSCRSFTHSFLPSSPIHSHIYRLRWQSHSRFYNFSHSNQAYTQTVRNRINPHSLNSNSNIPVASRPHINIHTHSLPRARKANQFSEQTSQRLNLDLPLTTHHHHITTHQTQPSKCNSPPSSSPPSPSSPSRRTPPSQPQPPPQPSRAPSTSPRSAPSP